MKKILLSVGILFSLGLSAQKHYYWSANADFSQFGRVIDIAEVSPNVLALQTFKLGSDYSFINGNVSLFDLKTEKEGQTIEITKFDSYRGGFGKMSNGSLVVNTLNPSSKYEVQLYKPNTATLELTVEGKIQGSFPGIPGGIVPVHGGGYVLAASLPNKDNGQVNLQLFKKSKGHSFGLESQNSESVTTMNMLMKPSFMGGMHNSYSLATNPTLLSYCEQVALLKDEKVLALTTVENSKDSFSTKVMCYDQNLTEQWSVGISDVGYGFKPITTGEGNSWFLTTFQASGKNGVSTTTIQKYDEKVAVAKKTINEFEANGNITLQNGDLCVYGFKTYSNGQKFPAFHVLKASNLEIKKSWELSENDEPCKEISALANQAMTLPGKFYTATQMSNGDVVFGGHIISFSTVKDPTTQVQTTFNYVMVMPSEFFK